MKGSQLMRGAAIVLAVLGLLAAGCGASGSDEANGVNSSGGGNDSGQAADTKADEPDEPDEPEMPDLVDSTEDEARTELEALGVDDSDIKVDEQETMEDAGTIIDQVPGEGSPITGSVNLVIAVPVPEVPDFLGSQIDDVLEWAEDRAITVVETEVLDDEKIAGEVLATTPAPGEDPAVELAVDVVVSPVTQLLASLEPVAEQLLVGTGSADVNGETYDESILLTAKPDLFDSGPFVSVVEYDLGRDWVLFKAAVGLRDDSASSSRVKIRITVDGKEVFNEAMSIGTIREVEIDVTNALRIVFSAEMIGGDEELRNVGQEDFPAVVFGNARVTAPPSDSTAGSDNDDAPDDEDDEDVEKGD